MDITSSEQFERENFNVENYVKKLASESVYPSTISEAKDKLNRLSTQTAEEIKQSVYKNYSNFMETSKEVGHLEGKMSQLRQSLEEQRKLLSLFKNMNINYITQMNSSTPTSPTSKDSFLQNSSISLLLEQVEGCGVIVQKPGRNLLYHSDLEALHTDDYSFSHKLHAYLLTDALLLALPQRKRNKSNFNTSSTGSLSTRHRSNSLMGSSADTAMSNYQYKFHAFYELQLININNIDDSKEVRNSFQLLKFPESLAFRCANAHIKKEWLENIENARKQLKLQLKLENRRDSVSDLSNSIIQEEDENEDSTSIVNITNDSERNQLFSEFDILLAQRDFEKAVDMLLKIKDSKSQSDSAQQLICKQKESELINILRKDLVQSKERGNSKGVVKTGKRIVNSLIKLKIYDEAIDLFIDYHKYLNSETLKKIKLEESNSIYMNNVLNSFFENLKLSYFSFKEQFSNLINYCYSTYLSWCDTEIEILIKKLQSQHYLGRHFDITIENTELIFIKAQQFLDQSNFEVKFLFEVKLIPILEQSIKDQHDILMDASLQRSKLEQENSQANNEQNKQLHIDKLLKDLEALDLMKQFNENELKLVKNCTSSTIQYARGVLNFFMDCLRVYYQDINFCLVETFTKLFKAELKIYLLHLKNASSSTSSSKLKKHDIFNNLNFIYKIFQIVQERYLKKTGINSKHFIKLNEKFIKTREENF